VKLLLAAALFTGVAFAASAPIREVTSEFPFAPGYSAPSFRNGRLFQFFQVLKVYARDGTFAFYAPIRTPDGKLASARDIGVDSDDTFAVAANSGIALLDSRGLQTGFIETKLLRPQRLVISQDHSIWVLGVEAKPNHMALRKYSRDGRLLASYDQERGYEAHPTALMASGNEIALAVGGDLIHLDGDGNVLARMRLDNSKVSVVEFAFTSDGKLYGWGKDGLVLFDLAAGSWKKMKTPSHYGFFGGDEATLVYYKDEGDGMVTVAWFRQPD
jgi:hypothetical protein